MNYWEARELLRKVIGRRSSFIDMKKKMKGMIQEKGRKKNYKQFDLFSKNMEVHQRLLHPEEIGNFIEISCRAAACPMPLNADVYDSSICVFKCAYCFANSFRASLYSAFFDNSNEVGIRHCDPDYFISNLDPLMELRGENPHDIKKDIHKAIAKEIPIRFGIRYEDFLPFERTKRISYRLLKYLQEQNYPVMINTKSDVVGDDDYVKILADNDSHAAVHVTLISSDNELLKRLEPGAPSLDQRLKAMKNLNDAGVRVVARIEPFMIFINDDEDWVRHYMEKVWETGTRHITFDTYSYTAKSPGLRQNYTNIGLDWERMFLLTSESQGLGSYMLDLFMQEFRNYGFSCSTFDLGCAANNDQSICCEVGDWLIGGWNEGSIVMAARFIIEKKGEAVHWKDFEAYVNSKGGFLSSNLQKEVKQLWNISGNVSFALNWAEGIVPAGIDEDGAVWKYDPKETYRKNILEGIL